MWFGTVRTQIFRGVYPGVITPAIFYGENDAINERAIVGT